MYLWTAMMTVHWVTSIDIVNLGHQMAAIELFFLVRLSKQLQSLPCLLNFS